MSKLRVAFSLILAVTWTSLLSAADDTDWRPETEEAALAILAKAHESTDELFRFDVEYLRSCIDPAFGKEERVRVHVYCEDSVGFLLEYRSIEDAFMRTSQRAASGEHYKLSRARPETWLFNDGILTVVDEERRTYKIAKIPPNDWFFGNFPTDLAHQAIPPWLDPSLDWQELKSRLRIERAASTSTQFFVKFVPKQNAVPQSGGLLGRWHVEDDRYNGSHRLYIDRKSLRPMRWWKKNDLGHEQTLIYTRFDANPPRRELKVSLAGYKDVNTLPKPSPKEDPQPAINTASLELGARILFWLLF